MQGSQSPIAIVGVSALFPGSSNAHGFWHDILAGRDLITDVPAERWLIEDHYDPDPQAADKTYCRRGAFLNPVRFDPLEFGVVPSAVKATDTSQLLALIVAKQVLEDALGGQFSSTVRERASIILGVTSGQELIVEASSRLQRPVWVKALRESGISEDQVNAICDRIANSYTPWQENTFPGLLGNVIAGRIANRFDLGGSNFVTDAACASSLSALSMACAELNLGHSDLVITGGVDTFNDITMFVCFSKTPALSPTEDCRPFSNSADGTILGEGLGMFALQRLEDAERDGRQIYAVIQGIGSSSDGRAKSIYAPLPAGQARALRRAYEQAGYGPETVELMEAHGTGTVAGDAAEFESLSLVFGEGNEKQRRQWCALGSVKSQVGHTKAAAGAAGLFKAVLALHSKILPPTLKAEEPNPQLDIENSPFYLNTQARPWIRGNNHPRRASVSSFGFGGTNFHVALEEYVSELHRPPGWWCSPVELVLLSSASIPDLLQRCERMAASSETQTLAATALESQLSFNAGGAYRLAIVAEHWPDLLNKLKTSKATIGANGLRFPPGVYYSGVGECTGRIAFLFPGQGSQYLGMTSDLAMAFPDARKQWDKAEALANQVFSPAALVKADRETAKHKLTATEVAQPAIGIASAAILAILCKAGLKPEAVAGHSFGEVSALYAAGAFGEDALLSIASKRGALMAEASSSGTPVAASMTAVSCDAATLQALIEQWQDPLVLANQNMPLQTVLSGKISDLDKAEHRLSELGYQFKRLDVSTAFHSPFVAPAASRFRDFLQNCPIDNFETLFYPNTGSEPVSGVDPDLIRNLLAEQIATPVRFVDQVRRMYGDGFRIFVEVGPGSALTTFVRMTLEGLPHQAIATDRAGQNGLHSLFHAFGRLAASGISLDWRSLREGHKTERKPADSGAQRFTMSIEGGNSGRPYPPVGGFNALPKPIVPEPVPAKTEGNAVEMYRLFQETVSKAHREWQEHLARGHAEVIQALESAYRATIGDSTPIQKETQRLRPPQPDPIIIPPLPRPEVSPFVPVSVSAPIPVTVSTIHPLSVAPQISTSVSGERPTTQGAIRELLWSVVSEKTGYPPEMLEPTMALEADLGIDSIKRVEIFSAIQDKLGALEFDLDRVAELQTLGEIVQRFSMAASSPVLPINSTATKPAVSITSQSPIHAQKPPSASGLTADKELVLKLISDKTGYPVEMLEPTMELEADLGIDSIKRVEIFSALQEQRPDVPDDAAEMGRLRTIADVIGFIKSRSTSPVMEEIQPNDQETPTSDPLAKAADATAAFRPLVVLRHLVVQRDAPKAGHNMLDAADGLIAVVDDGSGVGAPLVRRLVERDYAAALVSQIPNDCKATIFLGGLSDALNEKEALAINRRAFVAAQGISAKPGLFVTVQNTGGEFRPKNLIRALTGGLAGIVRTAALEWPTARVKAIDIDTQGREPDEIADVLIEELTHGGPEIDVGLSPSGRRLTLQAETMMAAGGSLELDKNAFVVATGGARGITAACLHAFTKEFRPRLLILGRTELRQEPEGCVSCLDQSSIMRALLDDARSRGVALGHTDLAAASAHILAVREIRSNLEVLSRTGALVQYESLDIRDTLAVNHLLDRVRKEWGPVRGIVHGAGVLADKRICDLSLEQFDTVFDTKVGGLRALLAATEQDPLNFLALFSSIASRHGNPGQAAYAAANEAMNRIAHAETFRRKGATKVKALIWGAWDGGMVSPSLKRAFTERGMPLLDLKQGAQLFMEELTAGMSQDVEVALGTLPSSAAPILMVVVNRASYPYLDSHRVQDVPVFPVVGAIDLFLRATRDRHNGSAVLHELRVLRGIRLNSFENGGDPLIVQRTRTGSLEIVSAAGTRHYEAGLSADHDLRENGLALGSLDPVPWTSDQIYGSMLFHGPAFQVIRKLEGISKSGIAGILAGSQQMNWSDPLRACDAALLDGGLQLARLWGFYSLQRPSLPAGVGAIQIFDFGDAAELIRCEVNVQSQQTMGFVCDIAWKSLDGRLMALMRGVEMYAMSQKANDPVLSI